MKYEHDSCGSSRYDININALIVLKNLDTIATTTTAYTITSSS
jgi:hypothetical protein